MTSANNSQPRLADLDTLIRAGDIVSVKRAISALNRNKLSRAEMVLYAGIANRVQEPKIAYRLLHPLIRSLKATTPASDVEKIEYAEALRALGLIRESLSLLEEIDSKQHPIVFLRIAFGLMSQWRYREAIPQLKNFIEATAAEDYGSTIAKVNLAAALVIEGCDSEAMELLTTLRSQTKAAGHQLLYGNCLELTAQIFVRQNNWDLAEQMLDQADVAFAATNNRYSLYLRKWRAISKSMRALTVQPELIECRAAALQDTDWETLRECDLYIAHLSANHELLSQVYFGTPFEAYRQRVLTLAGPSFVPTEDFIWRQDTSRPVVQVFDVLKGGFETPETSEPSARTNLEAGQLMHRLLSLLATDFYRPLSVASAFSELFPGEHYFQTGSTNRVCQVVKRLRSWLEEQGALISIEEHDSSYRMKASPGVGFRIPVHRANMSGQNLVWLDLKRHLQARESFTKNDVIDYLKCSPSSAARLLRSSIESGQCSALGSGRQRKYQLAS